MSSYNQGSYNPGSYPPPGEQSRLTLRRVGVGSAFKVTAILSALLWAIFGLIFLVLGLCGVIGSLSALSRNDGNDFGGGALAAGGFGFVILYVVGIVLYAIFGGIVGALYAWLYNVTARWTGGLEVDLG